MKNPYSKTRKQEDPYFIFQGIGSYEGWEWRVLKCYQSPENESKNPYARAFCFVTSPYCPDGELGDTYWKDIVSHARMIKGVPDLMKTDVMRQEVDSKNMF